MDPDSSSKFIGSLTKFLQSLCNGYVEFEDGVELIGHIYLSVDTGKKGKKIDYILNEKVCKSDNSVTFISNSFHALPDKAKRDDSEVSDIGDGPPRSTNTGTVPSRSQQSRSAPSPNQRSGVHTGSKRPGSPLKGPQPSQRRAHSPPSQRRLISSAGRPPSGSPASKTVPSSPSSSSQDNIPSPSPGKKGRSEAATSEPPSNQSDNADIEDIPSNVLSINPTPDFASFLGSLTSDNQSTHKSPRDTKPDTDVTFIKEEFVSEPSSCAQAGSSGHSGRSGEENGGGLYPVMLHQNTSVFPSTSAGYPPGFSSNASSTATSQSAFPGSSTSQSDMFNPVPGTSQDGADPSEWRKGPFALPRALASEHMAAFGARLAARLGVEHLVGVPSVGVGMTGGSAEGVSAGDGRRWECDGCGRAYAHQPSLCRHKRTCPLMMQRSPRTSSFNFSCWRCGQGFASPKLCEAHTCPCESSSIDPKE